LGGVSVGQALAAPNGGSASSKLAEWARDHYLGPLVTLGERMTYTSPQVGGKPSFSLAVPSGEAATASAKLTGKAKAPGFQPDIPASLTSLEGRPLSGEGQRRVLEQVHGQSAVFGTYLRDATYTSYVNGIVSMDQRLVSFHLHPGSEDPGGSNWGPAAQPWIPPGSWSGLLATFNGGFKLDSGQGGFYLNGHTSGTLTKGAASVVYYKNGTIAVGTWDQTVTMTSSVAGVRQNLKLIVDQGKVPPSVNQNVETNWGATLGGGYYVWRSGLGVTRDGRVIFAYGPALNAQDLAQLLQRAGVVEGLQLDINPYWMSYEYYQAGKHPADPAPVPLLPTQQQTAYRYYSPYSRDFTFGDGDPGFLSFPRPGWALALDFPARTPGLLPLLDRLDRLVIDHGGRVYLAKDSRVGRSAFDAMYPRARELRALRDRIDPGRVFVSDLSRRLGQ
jgi:FAD/FMN-containing dehydrogenase